MSQPWSNAQKKELAAAIETMGSQVVTWSWGESWSAAHNSKTSQLGGFKPASRRDSQDPKLYVVGMFAINRGGRIVDYAKVEASFATEPTMAQVVEGLKAALEKA